MDQVTPTPDPTTGPGAPGICVLGMHRSGTSAIAGILGLLGAYLGEPEDVEACAPDNPTGFWEARGFREINDALLERRGGSWRNIPQLDQDWERAADLADLRSRAEELYRETFAPRPLWAWKDPRTCLTLPFWQAVIPSQQYLVIVRDPLSVAASLAARDGLDLASSLQLWLAYNTSALAATAVDNRVVVLFEDLMLHGPGSLTALQQMKPPLVAGSGVVAAIDQFLREDLWHHRDDAIENVRDAALPAEVLGLYSLLRRAAAADRAEIEGEREVGRLGQLLQNERQSQERFERQARRLSATETLLRQQQTVTEALRGSIEDERAVSTEDRERVEFELAASEATRARIEAELHSIRTSRLWAAADTYWRARRKFGRLVRRPRPATTPRASGLPVAPEPPQFTSAGSAAVGPTARRDVIIFPIIDWEFRFQRPQQLACQMASAGHRVFYLRTRFQERSEEVTCQRAAERIFFLTLPGPADFGFYTESLGQSTADHMADALGSLRCEARIHEAICIVQLPTWRRLALQLRARWGWPIVYDCMDEHSGFEATSDAMLRSEPRLVAESDLVVTSASKLMQRVAPTARRSALVPNGADYAHFEMAARPPAEREAGPPVVGYFGAIAEWFDIEAVARAARLRPEWRFDLVGRTDGCDLTSIRGLPNVHLMGERPYADLPALLREFDVALIPFRRIPLTEATDPVKFYEYLSAGKPVVATELPELVRFSGLYYPMCTGDDLVTQAERAMQEDSIEQVRLRQAEARRHTWQHRARKLGEEIDDCYSKATIVIVSYNNARELQQCLESIWSETLHPRYRVVVVDNGSGPEVTGLLHAEEGRRERLQVIYNEGNEGFARANNMALHAATDSNHLILLNDDTIVTRGWLCGLLRHLRDPAVGLVGPVSNGVGNEARIDVSYEEVTGLPEFAGHRSFEHSGGHFDIPMLAMYCVAFRRETLKKIGPLDERFTIGMFEDDDFALRVRQSGLRVVCAEDVFIHHWGRTSFARMDQAEYDRLFAKNRRLYEEKWQRSWAPHRYRGEP